MPVKFDLLIRRLIVVIFIFSCFGSNAQSGKAPVRESIEWLDVWMPNTNDAGMPRVLLIGNSITRGYYPEVQRLLTGKAYVARLATSKSVGDPGLLKEIELILSYYKFDIVHFNNGLHGWGYTEDQYRKAFPSFVKKIRAGAPHAKLIWATITPIRSKENVDSFDPRTERVKVRNKIALEYISKQNDIRVDDLWTIGFDNSKYYAGGDGTHPNKDGYSAFAQQVASELSALLEKK